MKKTDKKCDGGISECGYPLYLTYQVRPYYDGAETLMKLYFCIECGHYEFEDLK